MLLLSSSCSVSQLSSKERSCRDYREALQTGGVHCVSLCLDRQPQLFKKKKKGKKNITLQQVSLDHQEDNLYKREEMV